jgi:hypothetical protein
MPCTRSIVFLASSRRVQAHGHVDSPDHQNTILLLHFSGHIGCELSITGVNLTRFQRASEGSQHSTRCRRDYVVDGRGVRLRQLRGINVIVLGYRSVDAVDHGLGLAGQICDAQRSLFALDPRLGNVDNFAHLF